MTRDGVCHGKNKQNFKFDIMYSYINQLYIEGLFSQYFYTVAKFSQKILYFLYAQFDYRLHSTTLRINIFVFRINISARAFKYRKFAYLFFISRSHNRFYVYFFMVTQCIQTRAPENLSFSTTDFMRLRHTTNILTCGVGLPLTRFSIYDRAEYCEL